VHECKPLVSGEEMDGLAMAAAAGDGQGLTLVHVSAQLKRILSVRVHSGIV